MLTKEAKEVKIVSEPEKRELLESIKRLPPEKQIYVAGVAAGLALGESPKADEPQAQGIRKEPA